MPVGIPELPELFVTRRGAKAGLAITPITQEGGRLTYFATSSFACDSTATDIAVFQGAANVTACIMWIVIGGTMTAANTGDLLVIRRTAANTAGTAVNATLGQADIANDAAPACQPIHYTAHPTGLGAAAARPNIYATRFNLPVSPTVTYPPLLIDFCLGFGTKPLKVIGASDFIAINVPAALGGAGNAWDITWCWVEQLT